MKIVRMKNKGKKHWHSVHICQMQKKRFVLWSSSRIHLHQQDNQTLRPTRYGYLLPVVLPIGAYCISGNSNDTRMFNRFGGNSRKFCLSLTWYWSYARLFTLITYSTKCIPIFLCIYHRVVSLYMIGENHGQRRN